MTKEGSTLGTSRRADRLLVLYTIGLAVVSVLAVALGGEDEFWQVTCLTFVIVVPLGSFASCVLLALATHGQVVKWSTVLAAGVFFAAIAATTLGYLMKVR
jgi:hypothetical protein